MAVFLNKQKKTITLNSSYRALRLKYFHNKIMNHESHVKAEREFRSAVDVASAELPTAVEPFESDAIYSRVSK